MSTTWSIDVKSVTIFNCFLFVQINSPKSMYKKMYDFFSTYLLQCSIIFPYKHNMGKIYSFCKLEISIFGKWWIELSKFDCNSILSISMVAWILISEWFFSINQQCFFQNWCHEINQRLYNNIIIHSRKFLFIYQLVLFNYQSLEKHVRICFQIVKYYECSADI